MLMNLLLIAAAVIVVLIVIVAMRPSDFRITRTAIINGPPAAVFAQVNDFHKWDAWSPWAKMDPACKNTFEGPTGRPGAVFAWAGNQKVGEGRMTLTESRPNELIRIKLEFFKPFKATNTAEFAFKSQGAQTVVTWSMSGKNNFMAKAFGMLVNCDKMVGGQFEQGLSAMKSIIESSSSNQLEACPAKG